MLDLRSQILNIHLKPFSPHFYNAQKYKEEMILGNEIWVNILGISL
tara:strand:+ start:142156 stop:142293 length:138 start_codon:yes stop_codon:yes gene_type:complete